MPFYESLKLPFASKQTLQDRAHSLYERQVKLSKLKVSPRKPKDFLDQCNAFETDLDKVFPASSGKLKDAYRSEDDPHCELQVRKNVRISLKIRLDE